MLNFKRESLPLKTTTGRLLTLNREFLEDLVHELEEFLENEHFMNNRTFSKKVMFTHEIKANNTVEGINDSVTLIERVIDDAKAVIDSERRNRIINLYNGYKYILGGKEITAENVGELYKILSRGLLCHSDSTRMGELYRTAPVYILRNGRLDGTMDEGVLAENIPEYMENFFSYVNDGKTFDSPTDYFIKSQIMHFYFVYIHPYFDINGRTSRTVAMWYLLNNGIYPYIIFNRGINFDSTYDKVIRECKDRHELTKFLRYMLLNVKKELEKEYLTHHFQEMSCRKWSTLDYQTLEYILSMRGNKTVLDFTEFYNNFNDKKRAKEVFETMILPMIDDGTIDVVRNTKKRMFDDIPNVEFALSQSRMSEIDTSKVKRLVI